MATGSQVTDGSSATDPAGPLVAGPLLAGLFGPADEEAWLVEVDRVLKGAPFDRLVTRTDDGVTIPPLYSRSHAPGSADESGFPGGFPFTRGAHAAPRSDGRWDVRSSIEPSDPTLANRAALADLERGVTSLEVSWTGRDADLVASLEGVLLELAPVVLVPGLDLGAAADALIALWGARDIEPAAAIGGFGADPLATVAGQGAAGVDVPGLLRELGRLAARTGERFPRVRAVSVSTLVAVEAGASEGQELAVLLSTGASYLRAMAAAGMSVDGAANQVELVVAADSDVFSTVAKVRAARRLWASLVRACGASDDAAAAVLQVRTARRMLTRRDPWVNLLRVTAAVFGAAVGGADGVTADPYDILLGGGGELGRRMARNTQLLLMEESNLGRVLDPAGGSSYIESLTDEFAAVGWRIFQEFEAAGGMPGVLLDGTLGARIAEVSAARLARVATRRDPITGVSEFPNLTEPPPPHRSVMRDLGNSRDLASQNGEGAQPLLVPVRWAEPFESLRDAADALRMAGDPPRVFLANLGPVAEHTARATFAKNLFEAGGIEAVTSSRGASSGFATPDQAVQDFRASGARLACLCSSDSVYAESGAAVAVALRAAGAQRLYLAGRPGGDPSAAPVDVDEFIHVGVDVLSVLAGAHRVLSTEGPAAS